MPQARVATRTSVSSGDFKLYLIRCPFPFTRITRVTGVMDTQMDTYVRLTDRMSNLRRSPLTVFSTHLDRLD